MADIDWKTIIYSKTEVDAIVDAEVSLLNTAVSTKLDADQLGAPSGAATLDGTGKLSQVTIPYATSVEGSDVLNATTIMTPQRVHEQIDAKHIWGGLTGTLKDQLDLQAALDLKSDSTHDHNTLYEPINANIQAHIIDAANPHAVTKAQVGLGNVDDTSDANKPISTATQTALNLKSDTSHSHTTFPTLTTTTYVAQAAPTPAIGNVYFDSTQGTLAVQNTTGITTYVGRNVYIRVYNATGTIISKGSAVRGAGYSTGGLPSVVLAQADSFANAGVVGIAAEDIVANGTGLLIRYGVLTDVDTSGLTAPAYVYLSATTPGALTSTQPTIISRMGGVMTSSVTGSILVDISNMVVLPTTSAILEEKAPGTETLALTAAYQNITNYKSADVSVMTANTVSGTISPATTAKHRLGFQSNITFASTTTTRIVYADLYDTTTATTLTTATFNIPRDTTSTYLHFSKIFNATAGDNYVIRMRSVPDMGITLSELSYDIFSI